MRWLRESMWYKGKESGTSLVVQHLRLCAPNAGGLSSIPDQGTRSRVPQLRACMPQLKIPLTIMEILHSATKTRHSQINKYLKKKKKKEGNQVFILPLQTGGGNSFLQGSWLIHAKGMKTLEYYHLVTPYETIILGNDYKCLLKLSGKVNGGTL